MGEQVMCQIILVSCFTCTSHGDLAWLLSSPIIALVESAPTITFILSYLEAFELSSPNLGMYLLSHRVRWSIVIWICGFESWHNSMQLLSFWNLDQNVFFHSSLSLFTSVQCGWHRQQNADDWIQTANLRCQKRLLCQLCHIHGSR